VDPGDGENMPEFGGSGLRLSSVLVQYAVGEEDKPIPMISLAVMPNFVEVVAIAVIP
jgi:hypothetical protein